MSFHPHPPYSPQPPPQSQSTSPIQRALVAFGLVVLSVFIALPNALFGLFALALLLLAAGAPILAKLNALAPDAYSGAVHIALVLISITALVQLTQLLLKGQSAIWKFLLQKGQTLRTKLFHAPPPPFVPAPPLPTPKRFRPSPWHLLLFPIVLADLSLIPLDLAGAADLPDGVLGASVLISLFLVMLGSTYALYWLWKSILSVLWRGARASPFFAGVVATGSLGVSVWCYTLGAAVFSTIVAIGIPQTHPQPNPTLCEGDTSLECSRRIFLAAASGPRNAVPPLDLAAATNLAPRPPENFKSCAEELHRYDPEKGSAYEDALKQARLLMNDSDEARDVVQITLIAVCAGQESYRDVRAYFIRSVINNAQRTPLRKRRTCSLDEDDARYWIPISCHNKSAEEQAVTLEMEATAQEVLCSLPQDDQQVIELVVIQGYSHRAVAKRLGCREDAARQKYKRAMAALRSRFHERCP